MKEEAKSGPEEQLAKGRGKESLLRVTLRNQVNLIAIADRRARIVLNLTTLLISLSLISLLTTDIAFEQEQLRSKNLTNPLVVLMITSLISAMASVVSLNPIRAKESSGYADKKGMSLLFSKNLSQFSLEGFREKMRLLLSTNDGIYNALITDIYNFGRLLNYKLRLLHLSYWILMGGLIASVLVFLIF